ncbi:hypothetical protein HanOQP8_Chr03g0110971 [Helianthus annuus]|nr:hypothetical protein HanOQP8_Chr03g0110971 [Helianthus annuus]
MVLEQNQRNEVGGSGCHSCPARCTRCHSWCWLRWDGGGDDAMVGVVVVF